MSDNTFNGKTIAKNTIILYFRMIFTMVVSLYTTRVFLEALGVIDYGIYNVVGGFVAMFGLMSGSLSAAISRFITYELGAGNKDRLKNVFSSSITIQIGLSILIILLVEAVGIWFVNNKMVIPENRLVAANWVLQISALTFAINLISIPYNAALIAHERMGAFAFFAILESLLKLLICFAIVEVSCDRLIFYTILLGVVAVVIRLLYGFYCKRHFEECTYYYTFDKEVLYKMFSFAGWNMFGAGSSVLREQGVNVLLNLFFGAAVNSARSVAQQVSGSVVQLANNIMIAVNPQITKNYAAGNMDYTMHLVFMGARFTMFLLLLMAIPLLCETEIVLKLWLHEVPNYTIVFVRLVLIYLMVEAVSYSMVTLMLATGDIKKYQIIVGGCQLLNFPLAWIVLALGYGPEYTVVVSIIVGTACMVLRLYMLKQMVEFPVYRFLKDVYFNIWLVALVALPLPVFIVYQYEDSIARFLVVSIVSITTTTLSILSIGCNSHERKLLLSKVKSVGSRFKR